MAYPPVHLHEPARYLSAEETASHISSYLSQATKNPYLHPDAIFTAGGLQFSNYGGSAGGLVLHQLRRVEKGLRGERIAAATADIEEIDPDDNANGDVLLDEGASKSAADLQQRQRLQLQSETAADVVTMSSANGDDDNDESSNKAASQEISQEKRGKKRKAPDQSTGDILVRESTHGLTNANLRASDVQETETTERNHNIDTAEYGTQAYSDQYKNQRKLEKKKRQKLLQRQKAEKLSGRNP